MKSLFLNRQSFFTHFPSNEMFCLSNPFLSQPLSSNFLSLPTHSHTPTAYTQPTLTHSHSQHSFSQHFGVGCGGGKKALFLTAEESHERKENVRCLPLSVLLPLRMGGEEWKNVVVRRKGDEKGERDQPYAHNEECDDVSRLVVVVGEVMEPQKVIDE